MLGLEDLKKDIGSGSGRRSARGKAEDEAVIALAEVMELYGQKGDGWESEFKPQGEAGEGEMMIVCGHYTQLMSNRTQPILYRYRLYSPPNS